MDQVPGRIGVPNSLYKVSKAEYFEGGKMTLITGIAIVVGFVLLLAVPLIIARYVITDKDMDGY